MPAGLPRRPPCRCWAPLVCLLAATPYARGGVVVLCNRTPSPITMRVSPAGGQAHTLRLERGEVRPWWDDQPLVVSLQTGHRWESFDLALDAAYFIGLQQQPAAGGAASDQLGGRPANRQRIGLQRIGLGGRLRAPPRALPGRADGPPLVIGLRLLADDDEATRRVLWEKKLRDRVERASRILAHHAGVTLRVVDVGQWESDNRTNDFQQALAEFEREVDPGDARLAVGFTSQYEANRGRVHLGGTRGPLRRHILIREWSRFVSETERLELLLHELGHFLGATHSPETDSVMRPVLGDSQSRRKAFRVRYDPVNTLIMAMVGEEMRRRGADRFADLSPATLARLHQVYSSLGQTLPDDPSTKRFIARSAIGRRTSRRVHPSRAVLRTIVAAATRNHRLPEGRRLTGDQLTSHYARVAAAAAAALPVGSAAEPPRSGAKPPPPPRVVAMLTALGVAIEEGDRLRKLPLTRAVAARAETLAERAARLRVLGAPTAGGRRDLAKHFFVSAMLTAAAGAEDARRIGLAKETIDASGGSGFSFADLAANYAGIRFAQSVLAGRPPLDRLAHGFQIHAYLPAVRGLPEGLSASELAERYGAAGDERFDSQIREIERRIGRLPAYAVTPAELLDLGPP